MKTLATITTIALVAVVVFVALQRSSQEYSEQACMATTNTPDCNGVTWRDVLGAL